MTWLEPMWLAYPAGAMAVLTALFAVSVRWWLRAFPEVPLNWEYELKYRTHYPSRPTPSVNLFHGYGVTATSASAILHVDPRRAVEYRRELERLAWLPEVGA